MSRWIAVIAVLVGGWTAAALMLGQVVRLTLMDGTEPGRTVAVVRYFIGMALIPVAPGAAAGLSAHFGWIATAWILGGSAAVIAVTVGVWMLLFATTT